MRTNRIEAFSDGVFAIAITLLALNIHTPSTAAHLRHNLLALWPSYIAYVISFLLIGLVWANHHTMFEHIQTGDRVLLFLNTLLLMDVAFLPFVTSIVALALRDGHGEQIAVVLYGATLVLGGVFFNAIWAYARHEHRLLDPGLAASEARRIAIGFMLGPVLYLVGAAIGAAVPAAGLIVFAALILIYRLPVTSLARWAPGAER